MTSIFEGQPPKARPKLQPKQGSFRYLVDESICIYIYIHSFIHLFIYSFIHLFVFFYSFIDHHDDMKMFKTLEKSPPYRKKSLEGKVNHLKTFISHISEIILGGGFWNNSGDIPSLKT